MSNLIILENGIVPVYKSENGQAVNARELHEFLESKRQFADWIKDRIQKYGFVENEDYISLSQKCEGNNATKIDYILKIDIAKEIAMVENNEKGSQARKYFIAIEKKFKENKPTCIEDVLIQSLQEMKDMRQQLNQVNNKVLVVTTQITENKQELQDIRDVISLDTTSWRTDTTNMLSKIAKQRGGTGEMYKEVRDESYSLLEKRAATKLGIKLTNRKRKVLEETGSKAKSDKLSKLDVIGENKRLTEVYIAIVKEMAIKYKVA